MSWQAETTAASNAYRDFLVSITALATSQHVATVVVNAAGTGWTTGDIATLTHAGAYHDARFEVTAIAGAITALRIISAGAFSDRLASALVNAGGSGYMVNDVLEIQGGTFTEKAKAQVATLSGSAVATVTVFETGGAYTAAPGLTGATTLGVGPAGFAGDDAATLDLTMTGLIGTTGLSVTGPGSGATVDITLAASGWSAEASTNDQSINSLTDEKLVVLLGTVAGGDAPYVALLSYTQGSGAATRFGIACWGMTAFNPALALSAQPGIGPVTGGALGTNSGTHIPVHEAAREWWVSVSPRKIAGVIRTTDITVCYASFYVGLMNGFGSATTSPYPMFIGASSNVANQEADNTDVTGLSECFRGTSGGSGPMYFRRKSDGVWISVENGANASTPTQQVNNVMFPVCAIFAHSSSVNPERRIVIDGPVMFTDGRIGSNTRANATHRLFPAPDSGDDFFIPIPLTVMATNSSDLQTLNTEVAGELDNVFWFGGTTAAGATVAAEDFIDDAASGKRYRIFPNGTQGVAAKPYQFFVMAEE